MRAAIAISGAALAVIAYQVFFAGQSGEAPATAAVSSDLAEIAIPSFLSPEAERGKATFAANCSVCHGENAAGRDGAGPPLVHKIYEPSHHADESFQRAVAYGVRQHHWSFGNMPPVAGLTRDDVTEVISYVRTLQRANGIN